MGLYFKLSQQANAEKVSLNSKLTSITNEFTALKNQDQVKKNMELQDEIKAINRTYNDSINLYQQMADLRNQKIDVGKLDTLYAGAVKFLADGNYASASAQLSELNNQIGLLTPKIAAPAAPIANVPQSNTPPGSGFSSQVVNVEGQSYQVSLVAADLNSTKIIVDTASDSDCSNNCPVLPLADYVSRNGAFAGINGSFFCPADYPSCAGKTNSFDTLLMNKNKHYFNSDNNVYSTVPAVIFSPGSVRFVGQSEQWGRDTGVDGVIANYPLLVSGSNISYSEPVNEPKFGQKGTRTFIATKGGTVYIGVIFNATMGESAKVLHALGMGEALNLDEGGSTAFWSGGYKAGPGRNIPNAILFVNR